MTKRKPAKKPRETASAPKRASRPRDCAKQKAKQSVRAGKQKRTEGVITVSDSDLIREYSWLEACVNVDCDGE